MPQKSQSVTILGIETSCDETAISIVRYEQDAVEVLASVVSSQIKLHAQYGGVVPNLAAREHTKNILPVLKKSLEQSHISIDDIDALAVTQGPGLIPALLVGTTVARTLSWLWQKPLLGIHHIEGHIYANFIHNKEQVANDKPSEDSKPSHFLPVTSCLSPKFPILALVVSGGHTQLILMQKHFDYEIVGETQDDAVGEAFDKVARILGLGYPGGPAVAQRAAQTVKKKEQHATKKQDLDSPKTSPIIHQFSPVTLPRPMLNSQDLNFSFSGLKTAVLYAVQKFRKEKLLTENTDLPDEFINTLCAEFQQAAIDVLIKKTLRAAKQYKAGTVILAGGVSANTELRRQLGESLASSLSHIEYKIPEIKYSVDNAAMIAAAASFRWIYMSKEERKASQKHWEKLKTQANLSLESHKIF